MSVQSSESAAVRWLEGYQDAHHDLLSNDPEFARWLAEEYVPIAGGWQY